jgi:hypothetical protein
MEKPDGRDIPMSRDRRLGRVAGCHSGAGLVGNMFGMQVACLYLAADLRASRNAGVERSARL